MTDTTHAASVPALEALQVVDFAEHAGGRFCARLLGDAGADVVRIPWNVDEGDTQPSLGNALAAYVDRGKGVLDDSADEDIQRLLAHTDVAVFDAPHGTSRRVADSRALTARHPALVSVVITPFGETGPRADWMGDDLIAACSGGLANATPGLPDFANDLDAEPPLRPDARAAEFMSGLHGAVGALVALLARERNGLGQQVEISMQDVVTALLPWDINLLTYGGNIVGRREVRAHLAPNAYLSCADGWNAIVAFTEAHWRGMLEIMGQPEWADNDLFSTGVARGENWDALEPLIADWLKSQQQWSLLEEMQRRRIPSAPALELRDAIHNEHSRSRGYLASTEVEGLGETLLPGDVFVVDGRRQQPIDAYTVKSIEDLIARWAQIEVAGTKSESVSSLPPLAGVRVIDFGQFVAMPLAGEWLAMMGAEVLLVETRKRLQSRLWAPFADDGDPDTCGLFNNLNLGKRSITLNLQTAAGVDLAKRLIAKADLVLENFSPGTMAKLGLNYEELQKVSPRVSMVSLSAFGSSGPWRDFVSFHSGVAALSGFAAVTGYVGGHPRILGAATPDTIAASYCLFACLRAIHHLRQSGEGQHIEIAMSETLQSLMAEAIAEGGPEGAGNGRIGNRDRHKVPCGVYRCLGEDAWVAISVGSHEQWRDLCQVIGRPDLMQNANYATPQSRRHHEQTIDALLNEWSGNRGPNEAAAELQAAGVPSTKVFNARDIVEDTHLRERGTVVTTTHPKAGSLPTIGAPWKFSALPQFRYRHAPLVGDGNVHAFQDLLGLSAADFSKLVTAEVIY